MATRSRTSPRSSRLYRSSLRRLATSCPGGLLLHPLCRRQHLSLLVAEGDPLRLPPLPRRSNSFHPSGAVEPVVSGVPSPSRPPPRGAAKPRARGPRTGDPEMIGTALQEMVTAPLLPSEEGRVVNPLFFPSVPPASGTQIFDKRAVSVISGSEEGSESSGRSKTSPLSSTSSVTSGQQCAVRDGHPSLSCTLVRPWNQVSVAQYTQTPLRAASQREPPEPRPCVPPRCPTAGMPVVPLVPLVRSLRAWLALPSPSRWLIRTIRLGYYQAQGVPCPLRLRAHSTRGVASSWALARGASLTDICRAAGWATPNTFARFYSLRVEPVSSRVLTSGQRHGEVPA